MQKLFIGKGQYVDQQGTEKKTKQKRPNYAQFSNISLIAPIYRI